MVEKRTLRVQYELHLGEVSLAPDEYDLPPEGMAESQKLAHEPDYLQVVNYEL